MNETVENLWTGEPFLLKNQAILTSYTYYAYLDITIMVLACEQEPNDCLFFWLDDAWSLKGLLWAAVNSNFMDVVFFCICYHVLLLFMPFLSQQYPPGMDRNGILEPS